MNWLAEMEDERQLLKRVVAAFYLLACIAGLSCIMPRRARSYMLGVLRRVEVSAIEVVSGRARDRGLTLHRHDHRIGDALLGGDTRAEAMHFARNFRLLAILLDHLIEHCLCRQTRSIDCDTSPFAIADKRVRNLLAAIARLFAGIEASIPVGLPSCAWRILKPPDTS